MFAAFPACHKKKKEVKKKTMTGYIGIDIGKKKCVTCLMDQDGTILEQSSYPNTLLDASRFAKHALEKYDQCKAVVESTGNMWLKTFEAFESNGIEIKLSNPFKTRAIAEAKVKTDEVDSKVLAHLLRADLIAECYVPSGGVRQSRNLLGHKANLVRDETKIKNRIHSLLDKYDLECSYGNIFGVNGMVWLHNLKLDGDSDQLLLTSLLRQIEFLRSEEEIAKQHIAGDALDSNYVKIIMSMSGFDYYGASLLAAYIADIKRFQSPEKIVSWAGLCPSVHQSGESLYMGKMKDGNRKVKWIMIQAANSAARHDPRMNAYYQKKLKRHNHNVAITHVATKMLKILWHMLYENMLYNERNERLYNSKLNRMAKSAG